MSYIYVCGGASSGKSRFALTCFQGREDVSFIATAVVTDSDMERRIKAHKSQRPKGWSTVEEPIDLIRAVKNTKKESKGIIIDCLTFWVSNLIYHRSFDHQKILKRAEETAAFLCGSEKEIIVVTNELGMGIIPASKESRSFQKVCGEVNQVFAQKSVKAFFILSGMPIKIK